MPGTLPNATIKNAIDQVIQAVNDLNLTVNNGDTNVTVETADIVAKLEEIRTLYQTESTAGIVAQNTNFSDLIASISAQTAAIAALTLSCQTVVQTTKLYQTISAGGCGGGEAEMPPVVSTDPTQDPPPGWGPANPAITDRRCKACNRLVDGHQYLLQQLYAMNVRELGALGVGVATTAIVTILTAPLAGPFAPIVGVVGGVSAVVLAYIAGGLRPDFLVDLLNDEQVRKDLVCALYNADNAEQAVTDYLQVWTDNGANTLEYYFLQVCLTKSGATNSIDYSRGGSEVDLDGYVAAVDCSECEPATPYTVAWGEEVSSNPSNPIVLTTVPITPLVGAVPCQPDDGGFLINFHQPVAITSIVTNPAIAGCGVHLWYYYNQEDMVDLSSSSQTAPPGAGTGDQVRSCLAILNTGGLPVEVTIAYTIT